jgi:hypothetical protein
LAKASRLSSRRLWIAEMALAEKAWPHNSSVIALTFVTLRLRPPVRAQAEGDSGRGGARG